MKQTTFKGVEAIVMENDVVRATFLPSYGGKLASFFDKEKGYEWLFQSEEETLSIPTYGSDFSLYDSSGFDEVFPSIDRTIHPITNAVVPDHGEVWALPWDVTVDGEHLVFTVESPVFPYSIQRTVSLTERGVTFSYEVVNKSAEAFPFIWTPHALVNMNEHTRILVPEELTEVMTVEHGSKHLGEWGTTHAYPLTTSMSTGDVIDLARVEPIESNSCEKFYFTSRLKEGWCAIAQMDLGRQLRYAFPVDKVPYLGVWKTQGGYRGHYNLALEPCTGVYDDVYVAHKIKKVSSVEPNGTFQWDFAMEIVL